LSSAVQFFIMNGILELAILLLSCVLEPHVSITHDASHLRSPNKLFPV
jgi:hypothetical protein